MFLETQPVRSLILEENLIPILTDLESKHQACAQWLSHLQLRDLLPLVPF